MLLRAAAMAAAALPIIGFVSLLLRRQLDPHIEDYQAHFVGFGIVGVVAFALGYTAGEAAKRRGDARVLLLSLAFMATGGFLGLHAFGTQQVLFSREYSGFMVAIPVGLFVSAVFATASAFVDVRPELQAIAIRHRAMLGASVLAAMGFWFLWTVAELPPLSGAGTEAATNTFVAILAIVGTILYLVSAGRYWTIYRRRPNLLPAAVVACFLLLAEAMIGVAVTGERTWHASWWEWHALIVTAYVVVGLTARREWRDERFRHLYLSTTRERRQHISILFGDLVGFTGFAERAEPAEVAAVLSTYWGISAPLLSGHGGDLEKFIGDSIVARFNSHGDQPDHAIRAARAALALQERFTGVSQRHPSWPRLRIGVNSGEAVVREVGGEGHVAYPIVGDAVNVGARLESLAPPGGILIGSETYHQLPPNALVEQRMGIRIRGREGPIDAYLLLALP